MHTMIKLFYSTILILPFLFLSCSSDDKELDVNNPSDKALHITYKVLSNHPKKVDLMISYNDSQGNYIVKTVESGWTYEAKLPKGKKAFLSSVVSNVKDEYFDELDIKDCTTTTLIIENGDIIKEATGLSVVVELEP